MTNIGIEATEQDTWLVTWPAFEIIRAEEDTFEGAVEALKQFEREVREGQLQALEHGHPDWNHKIAHGPCTRED